MNHRPAPYPEPTKTGKPPAVSKTSVAFVPTQLRWVHNTSAIVCVCTTRLRASQDKGVVGARTKYWSLLLA